MGMRNNRETLLCFIYKITLWKTSNIKAILLSGIFLQKFHYAAYLQGVHYKSLPSLICI